jgi:hypothetical protein
MKTNGILIIIVVLSLTCCEDSIKISTEIKGHWKWKSTCGGIVGCVYPSKTNTQKMVIQEELLRQFTNSDLTFSKHYSIKSLIEQGNSVTYEIAVDDNGVWVVSISNNILTINYGSVMESIYERIR